MSKIIMYVKLPCFVDVETTTNCQLHCKMCPYHSEHENPQEMEFELYKKIIDQIDWVTSIKLCQRGEPLLSLILEDAIRYATKKGLRTIINTNGILLDKFKSKCLIKAGLSELILSDYNILIQFKNGCILRGMINAFKSPLIFTVKTSNKEKWQHITDYIFEPIYYNYSDIKEDSTKLPNWKCSQLFEKLIIETDGKVRCCCGSLHDEKYVGNINENSIKEIWYSKKLNKYRELHLEGRSDEMEMCRKCGYRKSIIKEENNVNIRL